MRIGINLRYLQKPVTGIERATLELIKAIDRLNGNHQLIGYVTGRVFDSGQAERDLQSCLRLELRRNQLWWDTRVSRLQWDLFGVGRQAARDRVDVFWGPSFSLPINLDCPGVVTIYDVSNVHFPEAFDRSTRLWHKVVTGPSARRAQAILTISESSRRDIVENFGVLTQAVHVIPLACDSRFRHLPASAGDETIRALQRYGVRVPFLLTVSQISPRKNLVHLVRVYARLRRDANIPHQLVLVGRNGWLYEGVYDAVSQEGLEGDVIFAGAIPDHDLIALYNSADVFVYPSVYEGFGLPVLEAMACGAPVVASKSASLPDVVGEAGILVSPTDGGELGEALLRLIEDDASRAVFIRRGMDRAAQFTWKSSAQTVLAVLQSAAGS